MSTANAARRRQRIAAAAARHRCALLPLALPDPKVRNALHPEAAKSLDLAGCLVWSPAEEALEGTWTWQTPELEVRIHVRELKKLGGDAWRGHPAKARQADPAGDRGPQAEVSNFLQGLPDSAQGVLVELDGKDGYVNRLRTADPKFAIRLGCADAGLVSQFIAMEEKKQKRGQAGRGQSPGTSRTLRRNRRSRRRRRPWNIGQRPHGRTYSAGRA